MHLSNSHYIHQIVRRYCNVNTFSSLSMFIICMSYTHCKCTQVLDQYYLIDLQFFELPFYIWSITESNQTTAKAFWENSKVVFSDFIITKNIAAPLFSSTLPEKKKKIYCFKSSGFSNSICSILKSVAITL